MHWNTEECQSRYRNWHFSKVCNLMKIIFTKNFHSEFGIFWSLEILMGANLAGICKFVLIYDNPPKCWFDKRRGWKTIFQCKINLKLRGKLLWLMTSLTWLENAELYSNFCRQLFTFSACTRCDWNQLRQMPEFFQNPCMCSYLCNYLPPPFFLNQTLLENCCPWHEKLDTRKINSLSWKMSISSKLLLKKKQKKINTVHNLITVCIIFIMDRPSPPPPTSSKIRGETPHQS